MTQFFLFGCASQSHNSFDIEHDSLENLKKSQNYSGLIKYYKSELLHNPEDETIRLELVNSYLKYNDDESADFYLNYNFINEHSRMRAHFFKGKILARRMDYQLSKDEYLSSLDKGNKSSELYVQLGIVETQLGNYEQAIKYFNLSRSKGGDDTVIKNNIAVVYIYMSDYAKAAEILKPIHAKNKDNKKVEANFKIAKIGLNERIIKSSLIEESKLDEVAPTLMSNESKKITKYSIQIAAFENENEAMKKVKNLPFVNDDIQIKSVDITGMGTWYRVLIGEFSSYKESQVYLLKYKSRFEKYDYFIQIL